MGGGVESNLPSRRGWTRSYFNFNSGGGGQLYFKAYFANFRTLRPAASASIFSDYILRVCRSLWDSFLYLGEFHWFLYLLLSYFYDPGMFIFLWSSNFVGKVVLNESMSAKMASPVSYLVYY